MYNYFPWPSNMRTEDNVLEMRMTEGYAGYGVYVMLLELLRDSEERRLKFNPSKLAFAINETDKELVERVISNYNLFTQSQEGYFSCPWLDTQLNEYDSKKAAAAEAGRRGAAKRWGHTNVEKQAGDSNPIATPIAPHIAPDSNVTNITQENIINKTQSKLLSCEWNEYGGKDLLDIARKKAEPITSKTEEWTDVQQGTLDAKFGANVHNIGAVLEVCRHFKLNYGVFKWLLRYTDNGKIGSPELVRLLQIYNDAKATKFTPKYPAEYVMTKCLIRDDR